MWLCFAAALTSGCASRDDRFPGTLEVDVQASRGGTAQVFFEGSDGFTAERSANAPLAETRAAQTLRFPLPAPVRRVRFDPFEGPGSATLLAMRFVAQSGSTEPLAFRVVDVAQVGRLERVGATLAMTTTAAADDASIVLSTGTLRTALPPASFQPVTPFAVLLAGAVVAMLIALAAAAVLRAALRGAGEARPPATWSVTCALLGTAGLVLGAKLWVISAFGSGVPYLDQWNVQARDTFLPFAWGELRWGDLLVPHNEHRVAPSRLLTLGLLLADGRWNPLVEQVTNALLHTLVAVLLVALLWVRAGRRHLLAISAIVVLTFALPLATENTTNGFQSCLYFVLFALLASLALLPDARPASPTWWLALAALTLGMISFGGGVLNVVCLGLYLVLAPSGRPSRRRLIDLAACAVVAVVGLALRAPMPPAHVPYVATDLLHFSLLAFGALAFPFVRQPTLAAVVWIPSLVMLARILRRRRMPDALDATLLALGAWLWVQAAAIGYSRGNMAGVPPSRYMDVFSFVFLVNTIAAVRLVRTPIAKAPTVAIVAWGVAMLIGLAYQAHLEIVHFAAIRGTDAQAHARNIRRYLATEDRDWFATLTFPHELPVLAPALLSEVLLANPFLRERLPPTLAAPLRLEPSPRGPGPFRRDGVRPPASTDSLAVVWGSYDGDGDAVGIFRSKPIACRSGALVRVDVAGQLNEGPMELRTVTASGRVRQWAPRYLDSGRWSPTWIRCPPGPFRVVARDLDPTRWFAIGSPIEYGWLSFLAEVALAHAWLVITAGALLLGAALVAASRDAAGGS